jgi:hypothetical protein
MPEEMPPRPMGTRTVGALHPLLVVRANKHDLGTVRADAGHLDRRSIVGHDHDGANAEQACRSGDRLGMVAARVSHHPAGALLLRQLCHGVVRPTNLERASWLKALGLDEGVLAKMKQGSAEGHAAQPAGSGTDVVDRGFGRGRVGVWDRGHVAILTLGHPPLGMQSVTTERTRFGSSEGPHRS